ncbi:hypothetical protein MTBLM5_140004 [Magnetospirillum sp. LM-5]|uniref:hypothetical protein n=1 Tax=Magnetospirillum sp. LM-5 TaxID=2681466 RepID=UPI001382B495|nr:hypothetical protein [Magnetospirillum sp. LM-5]CAA7614664.1 hypothetical protein MTBLM5_140004 [Magnetospirillum sp. LM-5]
MPDRLPPLIAATKTLASTPKWAELDDQFTFTVALDIDGVTQIGLRLRGRCAREYSDQNLTFQIEYQFRGIARFAPVTRVDWKPIKPHNNRHFGPPALRLMRFHASHIHPFQENHEWMSGNGQPLAENLKAYDLPIAIPMEHEPDTVSALMTLAGRCFNIDGMNAILGPPWKAPRLL